MARKHLILLVEDRPQDVRLTKRALKKAGYDADLELSSNGQEALDRIQGVNGHAGKRLPDLILLDWMMPLVNGAEVLVELAKDPHTRKIPVVVLTTSTCEADVNRAYAEGCNAYLTKPVDPQHFQETIEALGLFWLSAALLPTP